MASVKDTPVGYTAKGYKSYIFHKASVILEAERIGYG